MLRNIKNIIVVTGIIANLRSERLHVTNSPIGESVRHIRCCLFRSFIINLLKL